MRVLAAHVVAVETVVGDLVRVRLAAPPLAAAQPGQWIALRRPDSLSIVAHPFPLTALSPREGGAEILYHEAEVARLAPWLRTLAAGSALDLLGPWGRPLPIASIARRAVLLGSGARLTGLLALARTLVEAGVLVVVLHDAPTTAQLLPPSLLPADAEYHVATADGSAGVAGTVLDLVPDLLSWADSLYAALPVEAYSPLRDLVHRHRLRPRRGFATVLMTAPLACYAAACDGCAVPLRDGGYGLLCKDGPAFDLLEVA